MFEKTPPEMQRLRQWCCWKLERSEDDTDKTDKIPYQTNGRWKASSTNPDTWCSFARAVEACERDQGLKGIGFFFTLESGIVGIDLDKVRDPQTGEAESWAAGIVSQMNSFTELSQSGRGFHIFVRGKWFPDIRRKGRIECYDSARFFAMTGLRVAGVSVAVESRDLTDFHRRLLSGIDPNPPKTAARKNGHAGRDESPSGQDFRLIVSLSRRLKTRDADVIEAEIERRYPERYHGRQEERGNRNGKGYWQYNIERIVAKRQVSAQVAI